jgi:hypothetical protein
MKTNIIFLISFIIFSQTSFAQNCIPDSDFINSGATGIFPDPDENPNLPDGMVGVPYSTVVSFVVPADTLIDISPIIGFPYPATLCTINYLEITTQTSLPTGLISICEPEICQIAGNSNGCISISGTPLQDGNTQFIFNGSLNISVPISVPIIGGQNIGIPKYYSPFSLTILPNTVDIKSNSTLFSIYPNPVCDALTIDQLNEKYDIVEIIIWSVDGKTIEKRVMQNNQNKITIPMDNLENGVYIISISSNNKLILTEEIIKE